MRKDSHTVMFKPSCDCNLNCTYCYDRPMRERFKGQRASQEILDHTAKLMSEYAENIQWYFHGGEPTLLPHDYYYNAQAVFAKYYTSVFNQALQSNGIIPMMDRRWIDTVKDCGIGIGFSFDLYGQSTRLGKEVDITSQYEDMLEDFKSNGARDCVETVTVITNKTINQLIDTYEHFKTRFGKDYVMSLLLVFEIDESNPSGLGISEEDYITYYPPYLQHLLLDTSDNALIDRYVTSYLSQLCDFEDTTLCGFIECRRKWLAVNPDGSVMHCDREPGTYYNLGNILDYNSIDEIYESEMYQQFENDCEERLENYCRKCGFYSVCNGGCHSNHGSVNGTRVNKVNPRECYTVQQNIISMYDMLQQVPIDADYNKALESALNKYQTILPYYISGYIAQYGYDYVWELNVNDYRHNTQAFVKTLQYRLFRLFNSRKYRNLDIEERVAMIVEQNKTYLDKIFEEYHER